MCYSLSFPGLNGYSPGTQHEEATLLLCVDTEKPLMHGSFYITEALVKGGPLLSAYCVFHS